MVKRGCEPYYECSSAGDRRFSAFFARPATLNGRTIEQAYQGMKVFADGTTGLTIKQAKGKRAINHLACVVAYHHWWVEWVFQEDLLPELKSKSGLSDIFGSESSVCQADVLWDIRNEY